MMRSQSTRQEKSHSLNAPQSLRQPQNDSNLKEENSVSWPFISFMKEVATKAKSNQLDFLLVGNEQFFKESMQTI
jgi:hypothetical protein